MVFYVHKNLIVAKERGFRGKPGFSLKKVIKNNLV
jgi:hypothetical protein